MNRDIVRSASRPNQSFFLARPPIKSSRKGGATAVKMFTQLSIQMIYDHDKLKPVDANQKEKQADFKHLQVKL